MSAQDPTDKVDSQPAVAALHDLFALWARKIGLELRVAAPARVITYDPATQRANVALELLPVAFVEGEEVPQPPIVITGAAVRWPGGSLGYVTTPLIPGDTGHVVFSDRCLSLWLLGGGPLDPLNGRTHDLADAIFEPGLRNTTNAITPPTSLLATVVEGPLVWLGAVATQPAVLGTSLVAALNGYATAITAANSALNTAAQTYFGIPVPTAPQQAAFQTAWAAWNTATAAAQTALAAALAASLSAKVLVQ